MSKVEVFEILLDKADGIFVAGQTCAGRLHLKISERFKINSVLLKFQGVADVHWTESRGSGKTRRTVHYRSNESYIDVNTVLIAKKLDQDCYLEVGDYMYPFQVMLPMNCPTSFYHINGRIRYILTSTIDIPWAIDKHVIRFLTVVSPVDLNLMPALSQPAKVSETKKFGCCCFESEPCVGELSIQKGGYVAGESINFVAKIDNKSNRKLKMRVKLVQNIMLHTATKSKTCFREVGTMCFPKEVEANSIEEWKSFCVIPAVCPSSNNTCKIIGVTYAIYLEVDPSGCAAAMNVCIPMCIGTIPLGHVPSGDQRQTFERFQLNDPEETFNKAIMNADKPKEGEISNFDQNYAPAYPYFKDFSLKY